MKRPISPRLHGIIDYATVTTTAAIPELLDFPTSAKRACRALAGSYGGLAATTDYPLAVRRMVPLKAHGIADAVLGLALPAMPWLLGFARHRAARNYFLALTALTVVVTALTDWERHERRPRTRRRRRR